MPFWVTFSDLEWLSEIFNDALSLCDSWASCHEIWRNDWCRQGNESTTFLERSGRNPDPDKSENPDSNRGSLWVEVSAKWLTLRAVSTRVCLQIHPLLFSCTTPITSNSAVTKRPRDASCLLAVSFNSTKHRTESFIVSYTRYRFITACN